jgi:pimeloyl-ACP methyl ester carboxylesterase
VKNVVWIVMLVGALFFVDGVDGAEAGQLSEPLPAVQSEAALAPTLCVNLEIPVALAAGEPADYTVAGTLCSKPPFNGRTLQILIPGSSYSRQYWDWPLRPEQYSYVRALTDAGYATLSLDRIGIGASDHPAAEQVTTASNAFVVHQLVQYARAGRVGRVFPRIILVGHSFGSASQYGGVDGGILSGFLHAIPGLNNFLGAIYPAQSDPRFSSLGLPAGYLTTIPGGRGPLFYHAPRAEADVIALDEATKETLTTGEASDFPALLGSTAISQAVGVPVLAVIGQYDGLFCTAPTCAEAANEAAFYSPAAQLELHVIPDIGHDLNLHTNAASWFAIAREWADRRFGP